MTRALSDILPEHMKSDNLPRNARLVQAYVAFKEGRASSEDVDLILLDLAEHSGYFHVCPPGTPDSDVQRSEGARSVYARIMYMMNMPLDTVNAMLEALTRDAPYHEE